jgi:gas vesicle protein
MTEPHDSKLEIELLKRDMSMITKLCEKFDITIDKMQQVAQDISKIVYLQEKKFEMQEQLNKEVDQVLEKQNKEHATDIKELNNRIERTENVILTEIKFLKGDFEEMNSALNKKIEELNIWRYTVMGGVALVVFVISNFGDILKLFFR